MMICGMVCGNHPTTLTASWWAGYSGREGGGWGEQRAEPRSACAKKPSSRSRNGRRKFWFLVTTVRRDSEACPPSQTTLNSFFLGRCCVRRVRRRSIPPCLRNSVGTPLSAGPSVRTCSGRLGVVPRALLRPRGARATRGRVPARERPVRRACIPCCRVTLRSGRVW